MSITTTPRDVASHVTSLRRLADLIATKNLLPPARDVGVHAETREDARAWLAELTGKKLSHGGGSTWVTGSLGSLRVTVFIPSGEVYAQPVERPGLAPWLTEAVAQ